MKYRKDKVRDWLWGDLIAVKARLNKIKAGQRYRKDNAASVNEMCPFCGAAASEGGNYCEQQRQIYVCLDCKEALAYGYITESLKMKTN